MQKTLIIIIIAFMTCSCTVQISSKPRDHHNLVDAESLRLNTTFVGNQSIDNESDEVIDINHSSVIGPLFDDSVRQDSLIVNNVEALVLSDKDSEHTLYLFAGSGSDYTSLLIPERSSFVVMAVKKGYAVVMLNEVGDYFPPASYLADERAVFAQVNSQDHKNMKALQNFVNDTYNLTGGLCVTAGYSSGGLMASYFSYLFGCDDAIIFFSSSGYEVFYDLGYAIHSFFIVGEDETRETSSSHVARSKSLHELMQSRGKLSELRIKENAGHDFHVDYNQDIFDFLEKIEK